MKYTKNVLKVDISNFRHYWRGIPKIGKTTLFRDLLVESYGDTKFGLLISPGNETGYKALSDIVAHETPTWEDFVETVDDLVENKEDNEFKLVAIDTVDELISIASDKVLKVHFARKSEKAFTLNAALGGFGQGHIMVQDLINDQIRRLELAGYGLVFISHTKIKEIKGKTEEDTYSQLTSNMESRFDKIFADKADLICTFMTVKNVKDNKLEGTSRYIFFRNDGFVDAGSRFNNMPEKVEMSAKNYLEAFNQGVVSSFGKPIDQKEIERLRKEEIAKRDADAAKYVAKAKTGSVENADSLKTAEDYISLIDKEIASLDKEGKRQKQEELKEHNVPTKYKELTDIEVLKTILKVVSSK